MGTSLLSGPAPWLDNRNEFDSKVKMTEEELERKVEEGFSRLKRDLAADPNNNLPHKVFVLSVEFKDVLRKMLRKQYD